MVGAIGAYPDGSEHDFEMRTFAPRCGMAEDPVCGSMNASVGQWLTATGPVGNVDRSSSAGVTISGGRQLVRTLRGRAAGCRRRRPPPVRGSVGASAGTRGA
ncbi:PhzF family phenazine biosynthesis protein [Streptomyces sp. NPDC054834]